MFEHLPTITDESLHVMLENEVHTFREILDRYSVGENTLDEVVDMGCASFIHENINLMRAVRACAHGVFSGLEDEYGVSAAWTGAVLSVPGVLAVLRLVDREL